MTWKLPGSLNAMFKALELQAYSNRSQQMFANLTRLATYICGTPIALVALVKNAYQEYYSSNGTEFPNIPATDSFWMQIAAQADFLVIPDLHQDERWNLSQLATPEFLMQFYAGVPITAANGQVLGTLCVFDQVPRDFTQEQIAGLQDLAQQAIATLELQALTTENQHLQALFHYSPNPVLIVEATGQVIYSNPGIEQLLKQLEVGLTSGFLPADHFAIVQTCLERGHSQRQVEVCIKDRMFAWTYYPQKALQQVYVYGLDITEYKRTEEQLLHNAFHDVLTGLPNRALFMERLRYSVERAKRNSKYLFAILFLDLDRFKIVNDSLGHMIGDRLLIEIARRLETCLRSGDTVARLGGDEFAILLENIRDTNYVTNVAERIHNELASPFNLSGHEVFTTASIGIALSSTGYEQAENLLRDADTAMYRAKAMGKACHEVFDADMHARAVALLQLENDLRRAIERQEFRIFYQPIISLDIGRISGFEALVRWQHPEKGLVPPAEFIGVAEETRLILPIGQWAIQEACKQMSLWQRKFPNYPPLMISVNLSGKQLSQPDLIQQIDQILQETNLEPGSLKLEITESVIMENAESARALLGQLRTRSIQLSIDDFGTGYSSLSYLRRFPINTLKIDRSFISKMGVDDENLEIVRTIVTLAHNLGIYVTAEGVETEEQLIQLWALQCEYAQGYFFAQPLNSEAAEALIASVPQW